MQANCQNKILSNVTRILVLELCAGTLSDYAAKKYRGPMPDPDYGLIQMADGVHHIHSKRIIHRDIKPSNILISFPCDANRVYLKIADFGLSKPTTESGNYSLNSGIKGSVGYLAPEILALVGKTDNSDKMRANFAVDVFALGCVFYFYLTQGSHPFGIWHSVSANILNNQSCLDGKQRII
jgi:serine/threonine protein kinase